jgi:hypothetical protein
MSGMTAALESARTGYDVLLVEKTGSLGGWLAKLHKRVPSREPYADPQDTGIAELISQVQAEKQHQSFPQLDRQPRPAARPGRSASISPPSPGRPPPRTSAPSSGQRLQPYDINKLPELGGGKSRDVVDQAGLEQLAKAANGGAIKRPSDGKEVKSVVFVQCAGQRDTTGKVTWPSAPASAATPASSRPCTSRTGTRTSTRRSFTPTCAPRATARTSTAAARKGRHLHQGQGERGGSRRRAAGEVQGPDPERRRGRQGRPGGAGHRHGRQLRHRHGRPARLEEAAEDEVEKAKLRRGGAGWTPRACRSST